MIDPLQALLRLTERAARFPANSRYHGVEPLILDVNGRTIVYLARRFVPEPETLELLVEHAVVEGDRLDNLAASYFGDPELFWRICDANRVIRPDDLLRHPGRVIRIALADGTGGT